MPTKTDKAFSCIFFVILIAELICGSVERFSPLHYFTKPAIVISLMVFFWYQSHFISKSIRNLTMLALLCSLLGDVLLMFVDVSANCFMFGLVAFLLAHVMYILVFSKHRNPSKKPMPFLVILLVYAIGLFSLLRPGLGDMLIPVLIYMLVILGMATTSFLREGKASKISYYFVFFGAILFMVSDSLLAINKFHGTLPFANFLIMLSYALAQYFIVMGIKKAQ
ncbi:MAG: lysoplasmalogenase [Gelidibacter sp.]